jgi:hypothetical protein
MPISEKPPQPPPDITNRWIRLMQTESLFWRAIEGSRMGRLHLSRTGEPTQLMLTSDEGLLGAELVLGMHPGHIELVMSQRASVVALNGIPACSTTVEHECQTWAFRMGRDNGLLTLEAYPVHNV